MHNNTEWMIDWMRIVLIVDAEQVLVCHIISGCITSVKFRNLSLKTSFWQLLCWFDMNASIIISPVASLHSWVSSVQMLCSVRLWFCSSRTSCISSVARFDLLVVVPAPQRQTEVCSSPSVNTPAENHYRALHVENGIDSSTAFNSSMQRRSHGGSTHSDRCNGMWCRWRWWWWWWWRCISNCIWGEANLRKPVWLIFTSISQNQKKELMNKEMKPGLVSLSFFCIVTY